MMYVYVYLDARCSMSDTQLDCKLGSADHKCMGLQCAGKTSHRKYHNIRWQCCQHDHGYEWVHFGLLLYGQGSVREFRDL